MSGQRPPRARRIAVVLALVAAWCLQASSAHLAIIWRASVLSWDSPATQSHDELATQAVAYVDAARELRDHVGAGMDAAGSLRVTTGPGHRSAGPATARLTRSPPVPD